MYLVNGQQFKSFDFNPQFDEPIGPKGSDRHGMHPPAATPLDGISRKETYTRTSRSTCGKEARDAVSYNHRLPDRYRKLSRCSEKEIRIRLSTLHLVSCDEGYTRANLKSQNCRVVLRGLLVAIACGMPVSLR